MELIAAVTARSLRAVMPEVGAAAAGGRDDLLSVVGAVGPQDHRPGHPARSCGLQAVGDQPGCAPGGVRGPFPEPGRDDHRRRSRGRGGGQQCVQSFDAGVAVSAALLGVSVGPPHRAVHVHIRHRRRRVEQADISREAGQEPGGHRVQLPDVPEPHCPQKRAQRRWGAGAGEQPAHAAVPQHRHVRDRVSTGDHARYQRRHLQTGRMTRTARDGQMTIGQPGQAAAAGQRHCRDQPGPRHQSWIVEHHGPHREHMR